MTTLQTKTRPTVKETLRRLGRCLELVSMDPHFNGVTVGLYYQGNLLTVWSFSTLPGIEGRLEQIRDRLVKLGGLIPVEGSRIQARFPSETIFDKPMRFLFTEAVEKDPGQLPPDSPISAPDTKTRLTFTVAGEQIDDKFVYTVTAEGEAPRPHVRIRAVVGGYMRYGGCERVSPDSFAFPDSGRHDGLARVLLPYARNVSAVEDMLAASDLSGQMTTQTLGFSQT